MAANIKQDFPSIFFPPVKPSDVLASTVSISRDLDVPGCRIYVGEKYLSTAVRDHDC